MMEFFYDCRPFWESMVAMWRKGPYKGVLLAIVSLNANNWLFIVTYIMVKDEKMTHGDDFCMLCIDLLKQELT
jgi:hypothetical protein